jgi:prepilin-type processing-associated H-X9-DG protein
MNMVRRAAFMLLELLVVIAIIVLLIAILLPCLSAAKEGSYKSRCASNLNQIGKGFATYQGETGSLPLQPPPTAAKFGKWVYPITPAAAPATNDPIAFSFTPNAGGIYPEAGSPLANPWLLVLTRRATPALFICPSDPKRPSAADTDSGPPLSATPRKYLDFGESQSLKAETNSYGFAYPWTAAMAPPVPWWRAAFDSSMPLAADVGPSMSPPLDDPTAPPGSRPSNSKNHGGLGQNVVFADGHVDFSRTNNVGFAGDNIYSANRNSITVLAVGARSAGFQQFSSTTGLNLDQDVIMVPARP